NIKSCNQCHSTLAPTYNLKADGIAQFVQLGGQLGAKAAPPPPKDVAPKKPDVKPEAKRQPPDVNLGEPVAAGHPRLPFQQDQLEVVRNERRQNYDNQAYGKTRFAVAAALYPEKHPYRYLTIGRHEDLVAASVTDVQNFFKTWYVPANATLAIVGDFDVVATK